MSLSSQQFNALDKLLDDKLGSKFEDLSKPLIKSNHDMIEKIDQYIGKTVGWKQDQDIIAKRLDKMKAVLIEKGVATEQELNLQG